MLSKSNRRILISSLIVGAGFLVAKITGILDDLILARTIGPGPALDAYYAAFSLPDLLFTLNGLGYLALVIAFFWEGVPFFSTRRRLLDYLFIAFAAVTVLAWVAIGARTPLGYVTKLDEILLIAALVMDLRLQPKA